MKQLTSQIGNQNLKEAAIAIDKLSFAYDKQRSILHHLNLEIRPGERVGLIGPNGAGKTTLFLAICGLLSPLSGTIWLFGKPVIKGEFRSEIGFVFQNPDDQLFCPTVRDDVAFGPENIGLATAEVNRRVEEALMTTGVSGLAARASHQLSGGEKCMVAIASVLAMQPQVILYDEPSANLDLQARRRLINFLQHSPETTLVSSHDLELILEVCDRVLLLNHGQIIADGNPRRVMSDQQLMEVNGLEKPHSLP